MNDAILQRVAAGSDIARRTGPYEWMQDLPYTDGGLSKSPLEAIGSRGDEDASLPVAARLLGRTT